MSDIIFKFSYGLFMLSANYEGKDNGCIVNTAVQVTERPFQVSMTLNKANYTHYMIVKSGKFNLSFLSEDITFDTFKRFGFQSGKDVDKFEGLEVAKRSENGVMYITEGANAMISVKVSKTVDVGSHTIFIGEVTEEQIFSDTPSCTYTYYQNNVKPKPKKAPVGKKAWVCTVCGYIYDPEAGEPNNGILAGTDFEDLPTDYVCPICKHGAEVFKLMED